MKTPLPLFLLLAALLVPCSAFSQTIGYWQFGNNPDDPGSLTAANVTNLSSTGDVSQYALPGTGVGSLFSDPVPQNGLTNTQGVNIYAGGTQGDSRLLANVGQLDLGSSFTIEAYVNLRSTSSSIRMIASQQLSTGDQRSWLFGVNTGQQLNLRTIADGTSSTQIDSVASSLTFSLNTDYYVAAVFDSGNVTFYLQDLSTSILQSQTVTGANTSVFNVNTSFDIGNFNQTGNNANQVWNGIVDEVRLSNVALSQSQLLAVAEPSSTSLILGGLLLVGTLRRVHHRRS